jgi:sarcosine oxidase
VIVGLGAVGAATCWQLARRGARVLGLDRFAPPHAFGSSHGRSRITRLAIGEGADYVPLALRSHQIWRELEAATGSSLMVQTGGLVLGPRDGCGQLHDQPDFVGRTIDVARGAGIHHEVLDACEIGVRYPALVLRGDERGYYEPESGFLRPEACVAAQLSLARQAGADLRFDEPALALEAQGSGIVVRTARGQYAAAQVVVCAGAWLPTWLPGLIGPPVSALKVRRQTQFWFAVDDEGPYRAERFPVFIWTHGPASEDAFYGLPIEAPGAGLKVATEQYRTESDPDHLERTVTAAEAAQVHARHIDGRLRGVRTDLVAAVACPYTVAPQARFVLARAPRLAPVLVVSACSGHGFKHSAALGEALAQSTLEGRSTIDLSPFGFEPGGG